MHSSHWYPRYQRKNPLLTDAARTVSLRVGAKIRNRPKQIRMRPDPRTDRERLTVARTNPTRLPLFVPPPAHRTPLLGCLARAGGQGGVAECWGWVLGVVDICDANCCVTVDLWCECSYCGFAYEGGFLDFWIREYSFVMLKLGCV